MEKLPQKFKEKLIAALRSGKFGQCQKQLTDFQNNYCCLGVAARVAGCGDKKLKDRINNEESAQWLGKVYHGTDELRNVPKILRGTSLQNSVVAKLASMNDNGKSFSEIADYIEENL